MAKFRIKSVAAAVFVVQLVSGVAACSSTPPQQLAELPGSAPAPYVGPDQLAAKLVPQGGG
jgi:hypothetical protein